MTNSTGISPLRQRMIDDMVARGLVAQTQKGHIRGCKRFAAYLKRTPELATAEYATGHPELAAELAETAIAAEERHGIASITLRRALGQAGGRWAISKGPSRPFGREPPSGMSSG